MVGSGWGSDSKGTALRIQVEGTSRQVGAELPLYLNCFEARGLGPGLFSDSQGSSLGYFSAE